MEYLMTYGWAILVIAIVLAAMFELGVFRSPQASLPTECTAQSGFLCRTPVMNTTGNVLVTFGQSLGSTIQVTGVGCSNSTAQPNFVGYSQSLASGQQISLTFECPSSGGNAGSSITGTLWIQYTKGSTPGLVSEVATFTAKVTTLGAVGSSGGGPVTGYVPITLSNQQSSGTSADFQQMIYYNPSSSQYTQYESKNLSNIEFTTGEPIGTTGNTPLYAWIESNASTAGTNTVIWINLGSSTLSAEGGGSNTLVVYMNFLPTNSPVSAGYTGYAPELWCASGCFQTFYAQNDIGPKVFNFYDNFTGGTLNSGLWSETGSASYTVNNGLSVTGSSDNIWLYGKSSTTTGIVDMDIYSATSDYMQVRVGYSLSQGSYTNYDSVSDLGTSGTNYQIESALGSFGITNSNLPAGLAVPYIQSFGWPATASEVAYINYGTQITGGNAAYTRSSSSYIDALITYAQPGSFTTKIYWFRSRQAPPGDVMPSFAFGTAV